MKTTTHGAFHFFATAVGACAVLLLAASSSGQKLFVSDAFSVYEFTPEGARSTFATGFGSSSLYGLAFDSANNLYLATPNGSGYVYKFTPAGVRSIYASGLSFPVGLAFDRNGTLFETDNTRGYVNKLTSGSRLLFVHGLDYPAGMAFDSADNLFVTSGGVGYSSIVEITPTGAQSTFASGLQGVVGLTFDNAGNLYAADKVANEIIEFSTNGTESIFASGLDGPYGLAFDSAGNLFETDHYSGNIYEFSPTGEQSTFASGLNLPTFLAFEPVPEPSIFGLMTIVGSALLLARRRAMP